MSDAETLLRHYPILRFFAADHLPAPLATVSLPLRVLAWDMAHDLPCDDETAAGLRHLLQAKDCFVRAAVSSDA